MVDDPTPETPIEPSPKDDGDIHKDCIPIGFFGDLAKDFVDQAVRKFLEKMNQE
ncbi:MAG: hypothetical protein V2A76_17405 [Planctomycetota bacterium]